MKKTIASAGLLMLAAMTACSGENKDSASDVQADALYRELSGTYSLYLDSLKTVTDSARADSIALRLDAQVRKIYLKYPADMDFHISESQNDTLWRYVSGIASLRTRFHRIAPADCTAADSILNLRNSADSLLNKDGRLPSAQ